MKNNTRTIYFISDGTGITVETLGHSLLTQFEGVTFNTYTLRYVNSIEKAKTIIAEITKEHNQNDSSKQPIIFSTIADKKIREKIFEINAFCIDFFDIFINPLEDELGVKATGTMGLSHAVLNYDNYSKRMEAINFALTTDDGINTKHYNNADIILTGLSRSGKTPTCLYLAMQFGIKAANFPLTEEDFAGYITTLPKEIQEYKDKLFGLTITADRLHEIRTKRKIGSRYASIEQCKIEIKEIESLYKKFNIAYLNSSLRSVEELATHILAKTGLEARL